MFLARFQSRTKPQENSVFFSIVTASKGHLLDWIKKNLSTIYTI